jgi:hypothetical protein
MECTAQEVELLSRLCHQLFLFLNLQLGMTRTFTPAGIIELVFSRFKLPAAFLRTQSGGHSA